MVKDKDKVESQTNLGEFVPDMTDCVPMKSILGLLVSLAFLIISFQNRRLSQVRELIKDSKVKSDNSNN